MRRLTFASLSPNFVHLYLSFYFNHKDVVVTNRGRPTRHLEGRGAESCFLKKLLKTV